MKPFNRKLRLRTIFLFINLSILMLPLGGIVFFRIYENVLVRQTESELISSAAVLASVYKKELASLLPDGEDYGDPITKSVLEKYEGPFSGISPELDLSETTLLARRPDGQPTVADEYSAALEKELEQTLSENVLEETTEATLNIEEVASIAGENLNELLNDARRTTLSGMHILDYRGVVVAGLQEIGLSFAHVEEIDKARKGEYASVIRERILTHPTPKLASISRGTGIRVFIAFPVIHQDRLWGVIYLSRTPENILKHLYLRKGKVILAGGFIILVALLIALLTSHAITRPIYKLIEKTRAAANGDQSAMTPLEDPVTLEIELLSKSFSDMTLSLHQRSEYIRDFATHVSHEFKTPITSIRGATEILLEHLDTMPNEQRDKFLRNILQDSERLKRLVTRVIDLAKADNTKLSDENSDSLKLLYSLQARYATDSLAITIKNEVQTTLDISEDNLEVILRNLFDNSMQHNATQVVVNMKIVNNMLRLIITDNGSGISEANREKIFTPFFTTKRENGGTGLGLDIIKSLLEAHGGSIKLGRGHNGAQFIVFLVLADNEQA